MLCAPRSFQKKFIDRIVADSRDVALNHTAGLSLPQQVMMTLFLLAEMMDSKKIYQAAYKEIVYRRIHTLIDSMGLQLGPNPNYDAFYGLIDFEFWARKTSATSRSNTSRRTSIRSIWPSVSPRRTESCC